MLFIVGRGRREPVGGEDGVMKVVYVYHCRKGPAGAGRREKTVKCSCILSNVVVMKCCLLM